MKKAISVMLVLMLLTVTTVFAQQKLGKTAGTAKADGAIADGEYSWLQKNGGMVLGLTLSADGSTLSVGFKAPTKGWVAIGLGSRQMNGAAMFMGCDTGTKSVFSEETGSGRNHNPAATRMASHSIVKFFGNNTTIEFTVPAAQFTKSGKIDMIMAYGQNANLSSMHQYFTGFSVTLAP